VRVCVRWRPALIPKDCREHVVCVCVCVGALLCSPRTVGSMLCACVCELAPCFDPQAGTVPRTLVKPVLHLTWSLGYCLLLGQAY